MKDRNPNLREKYLDGEKLFRKYFEMGEARTVQKLSRWAINEGMARRVKRTKDNPDGLPTMGIWKAMWRWASLMENSTIAWNIFNQYIDTVSWEEYKQDMVTHKIKAAWQHPTDKKRNKFLKDNGWI